MEEGDVHGVGALAGSLVDEAYACGVSLGDCVGYAILYAECHVVHALAALLQINRKVLADLAVNNPEAFKAIVAKVK